MTRRNRRPEAPAPSAEDLQAHEARRQSRRNFLKLGTGAAATLVTGVPTVRFLGDAFYFDQRDLRQQDREREQYIESSQSRRERDRRIAVEAKDSENVALALALNKARRLAEVRTDSGVKVDVHQTGDSLNRPLSVNSEAINASIGFLIGAMDKINEANKDAFGKPPIDPKKVADFQARAARGELNNVHLTVILSSNGTYLSPSGGPGRDSSFWNSHPHTPENPDVRETFRPIVMVGQSVDDYWHEGHREMSTTKPSAGPPHMETWTIPHEVLTKTQLFDASFTHETCHALSDAVLSGLGALQGDPEHIRFVTPLTAFHTAAVLGQAEGAPRLEPAFNLPPDTVG